VTYRSKFCILHIYNVPYWSITLLGTSDVWTASPAICDVKKADEIEFWIILINYDFITCMFWRKVMGELPCKVFIGCKCPQAHIEVYAPFWKPGCCSPSRGHVLSTPVLNIMKRKPCLHDGTVTVHVDTYKNRLVKIPPSSDESPNDGLTRVSKHLELNRHE